MFFTHTCKRHDPPTHLRKCIALSLASIASRNEANWPQAFAHPEGQERPGALKAANLPDNAAQTHPDKEKVIRKDRGNDSGLGTVIAM